MSEYPITQDPIIIEVPEGGIDGMSVRPCGEWDAETEYNNLDLVSYNGSSYIAMKTVPEGTLPTDTDYWMVSALSYSLYWGNIQGNLEDQTDLKNALDLKADVADVYTKTEADTLLDGKADKSNTYTKTETDTLLSAKADADTVYTKTETDNLLSAKADVGDSYTKAEDDALLADKADKSTTYTKTDVDSLLADKADADDVYTKTEADALLAEKADTDDLGDLAGLDSISYTSNYLTDKPTLGALASQDSVDYDTEVTNKPTLGALASKDTVDYETEVTNKPTLGTMSAENKTDYYTKSATDALLLDKAPVILSSASGSIASFPDGSPAPVTALNVGIEPQQDLHGQSSPWPAGGGKNLVEATGEWNVGGDGKVSAETGYTAIIAKIVQGETYTISKNGVATVPQCMGYYTDYPNVGDTSYDGNRIIPNNATFTAPIDGYILARMATSAQTGYQIEKGSSATSYAPYSNICPITGWTQANVARTGKNLLQNINGASVELSGVTFTKNADGSLTLSGTASATVFYNVDYVSTIDTAVFDVSKYRGITITGSISKTAITGVLCQMGYFVSSGTYYNTSGNFSTSSTFQYPSDAVKTRTYIKVDSGTSFSTPITIYPQLELGSSATAYEPYTGTSVTISLGSTVYGGTVDVLTGTMKVDRVMQTYNGTEEWTVLGGFVNRFRIANTQFKNGSWNESISNYLTKSQWGTASYTYSVASDGYIYICLDASGTQMTTDQLYAYLASNNLQILAPLAQPVTIPLTPEVLNTLLGQNNIWADTGDVAVEYRADTKLYVDGQISSRDLAIKSIMTSVEAEMKATQNYTSGQVVIVGDSFYKLTSNVSSGSAFNVGTNCTKTDMASWILSLI